MQSKEVHGYLVFLSQLLGRPGLVVEQRGQTAVFDDVIAVGVGGDFNPAMVDSGVFHGLFLGPLDHGSLLLDLVDLPVVNTTEIGAEAAF